MSTEIDVPDERLTYCIVTHGEVDCRMAIRDLGVSPDYVDRAFKKLDAEAATRDDPKGYLGVQFRSQRVQSADLKAIQANRPLKPPGKGGDFSFQSPMTRAVLFERGASEEKRRRDL